MQELDFAQFANSAGWHVVHDKDTQLYYIENTKGARKPGVYTNRRFAEKDLFEYLEKVMLSQAKIDGAKAKLKDKVA